MKRILLLILLPLLSIPSFAGELIQLYKQYVVGMPKVFLQKTPIQIHAATYSVGRKNEQVVATISFIVPGIIERYLDQNPVVEHF